MTNCRFRDILSCVRPRGRREAGLVVKGERLVDTTYILLKWLHDVGTVIWFGGMFFLGIILIPSARKVLGAGPQLKALMTTVQRRLEKFAWSAMAVLGLTGVLLARYSPDFVHMFHSGTAYEATINTKHVIGLVMIVIALIRNVGLRDRTATGGGNQQSSNAAWQPPEKSTPMSKREKIRAILLYLNILLALIVLWYSSIIASW